MFALKAFFSANKWAGYMAAFFAAALSLKAYEQLAVRRGKKIGRSQAERRYNADQERIRIKSEKTAERAIRNARKKTDRAAKMRDSAVVTDTASELPERVKDRFITDS